MCLRLLVDWRPSWWQNLGVFYFFDPIRVATLGSCLLDPPGPSLLAYTNHPAQTLPWHPPSWPYTYPDPTIKVFANSVLWWDAGQEAAKYCTNSYVWGFPEKVPRKDSGKDARKRQLNKRLPSTPYELVSLLTRLEKYINNYGDVWATCVIILFKY